MPPHMRTILHIVWSVSVLSLLVVGSDAFYARSEPGQPPEYCTVFHHMVKSGGSTIIHNLIKSSGSAGDPRPGLCVAGGGEKTNSCKEAFNSSAVIMGYAEAMRQDVPLEAVRKDCEYFTLLRHPVDRLVSAFFYCPKEHDVQSRPPKWCGYADHPLPATDRLLDYAQQYWKNMAYKQMAFGMYCPHGLICEATEVRTAPGLDEPHGLDVLQKVEDILSRYTAVGIMEHWDLSMQLFNARVRSPVREWNITQHSNAGLPSELRDEVLQWAHDSPVVHRLIATDMLLYSFALSIFKRQTTEALGTNWLDGSSWC
ncbi:unnamed protein product [Ectocarpus sp. CCAP 1310/34]|nr:unnamed protein product [Ectocarpus sp. CCAP 1310/34]